MGVAPDTVTKDDTLALLAAQQPFVALRKSDEHYKFCGQVWICGIEREKVARNWERLKMSRETYTLC